LNNVAYNPIGSIYPPTIINNKALTGLHTGYSFDINSQFPPQPVKDAVITSDMWSDVGVSNSFEAFEYFGIVLQDLEGIPWCFAYAGSNIFAYAYGGRGPSNSYFISKVSINDEGQILLPEYFEGSLAFTTDRSYDRLQGGGTAASIFLLNSANTGRIRSWTSREIYNANGMIIVVTNGFISLKKKASGIQVESTPLSFPALDRTKCLINKDNYLYYLEGTAVKRLYLASGSSPETVYSNSRILTSAAGQDLLTASGNNLVFYQFETDNITVNTYSLPMYEPGAEPRLLSSVSADVRDIVELNF
jgi:hypothetical protein